MDTNTDERTIPWAIKLFRPVLKDLQLQKLNSQYTRIITGDYKIFARYNMSRCVIYAHKCAFSNVKHKGAFIMRYISEKNIYILHILLGADLYEEDIQETKICRKLITTHEFTHCVAALMTLSLIETKLLIQSFNQKMRSKFHYLEEEAVTRLLDEMAKPYENEKEEGFSTFPDSHFRTGYENFRSSYCDLNRNFLLSLPLLKEYLTNDKIEKFLLYLSQRDNKSAMSVLQAVIDQLSREKNLDHEFVFQRIREEIVFLILKSNS